MVFRLSPGRPARRLWLGLCAAAMLAGPALAQNPPPPQPTAPAAPDPATAPHRDFGNGVIALTDVNYSAEQFYRPLKLDIYLNPAKPAAPRPIVIWLHGGGWYVGDQRGGAINTPAYRTWPPILAQLAARGYVIAGVSYRFSGEVKFPGPVQDVKTAIRWVRANAARYGADPDRIILWGASAGAQMAALAGVTCNLPPLEGTIAKGAEVSSCVQGVVDFYGPIDVMQMDAQRIPGTNSKAHDIAGSSETGYFGCVPHECPAETLKLANPINFISRSAPPFLIIHGDADTSVPPKQSQILYDALKAGGVKAELMYVPGANHVFAGATDVQGKQILDKVYAFLDETTGTKR